MYCKRCGTKNKDDALFCANCGQKLKETPVQKPEPELEAKEIDHPEPEPTKKPVPKNWIIAIICVIVVAAGIIGYQYSKSKNKKESAATAQQKTTEDTTQNTKNKTQGEDVADSKDGTDAEDKTASKDTADDQDEDERQDLPYTNNEEMDLNACTDPDNYQYVTSDDKSFGFAYPKYLFNHSEVSDTDDQYILKHSNGNDWDIIATITKTEAIYKNDPVKNVQHIFDNTKSHMNNITFQYPQGGRTPKVYKGKTTMIIMGYEDSAKTECEYLLITSDNKNIYSMEIDFKDSDYKDEFKPINYVVDCMYRGCSFTNSTYQMRSFTQFQNDDMGYKK